MVDCIKAALDAITDAGYEVLKSYVNPTGSELIVKEYEEASR